MKRSQIIDTVIDIIAGEIGMDDDDKDLIVTDEYLVNDPIYASEWEITLILDAIEAEYDIELDIYEDEYDTLTIDDIADAVKEVMAESSSNFQNADK